MTTLGISIDRSSLTLGALVIGNQPFGTSRWIDGAGNTRPAMTWRRTYAQGGSFVHGDLLTAATKAQSTLTLAWYLQAATTTALETLMAEDEAALSQFNYTVTVTEDGVATTWTCDPADWSWGDYDDGMSESHGAHLAVTIPVYPVAT